MLHHASHGNKTKSYRSFEPAGIVPPQCAYHALLRACSHSNLPEHSRTLIEQLQRSGRRPDAQTIGWLSHALTLLDGFSRATPAEPGHEEGDGKEEVAVMPKESKAEEGLQTRP